MLVKEMFNIMDGEWIIQLERSGVGYAIFMCDGWFSECEDSVKTLPEHLKGLIFKALGNSEVACIRTREDWKPRVVITL